MRAMYEYKGHVIRVVDGDTLHVDLDLGADCHTMMTLRLMGVNAPEHGTPEGDEATEYVRNWVHNHGGADGLVIVQTVKDRKEKYGRYLAYVYGWPEGETEFDPSSSDRLLNDMLVAEGHAVPYDGGKR
jgi:micrococcal nuclease